MFRFIFNQSCCMRFAKNIHQSVDNEYRKAIATLNSLQGNQKDLQQPINPQHPPSQKLERIHKFLSRCGLETKDLEQKLPIIHVAGTKGKGSTCAFCESILRHHGLKTGLFTSPHLMSVAERVQINGRPLSKKKFVSYFWAVYDKLKAMSPDEMPPYFMFLTILAFKIFKEEQIDVAIIEVGLGGEYDYTNFLSNTAVVGITSLGYDHVTVLGNTLEEIAWQKAGIIKTNSIVIVSADQPPVTLKVIEDRAIKKKSASLLIAPKLGDFDMSKLDDLNLGITGPVQSLNASLAIQLANAWLHPEIYTSAKEYLSTAPTFELTDKIISGLENCRWPGRTQTLRFSPKITYYLDGAHNLESMRYCVEWFEDQTKSFTGCKKALIFNVTGARNPQPLMDLLKSLKFDYVLFCCNRSSEKQADKFDDNSYAYMSRKEEYDGVQNVIESVLENVSISEQRSSFQDYSMVKSTDGSEYCTKPFGSAASAHEFIETLSQSGEIQILITGSLHLVGAFLRLLDPHHPNNL